MKEKKNQKTKWLECLKNNIISLLTIKEKELKSIKVKIEKNE